jgi:subtilisin family serine protease
MKGETAMENKRRWRNLIILGLILILLLVLALCRAPGAPSTEPLDQPPPPEEEIDTKGFTCEEVAPTPNETQVSSNGNFIDAQLLLRGPRGIVQTVEERFGLTLLRICQMSYLSEDLVMGTYMVPAGSDPQALSDEINDIYNESGVTASPNYLIGPSAGACADPYSDGGSLNTDAEQSMFFTQWARQNIGLQIKKWTGWSNVEVAVFDTMPKELVPTAVGIAPFINQAPQRIEWPNAAQGDRTFQLKVYDKIGGANIASTPSPTAAEDLPVNMRNHGFFAASVIRLIAPNSPIHLIRVLGDNGCGSVEILANAIGEFVNAKKSKKLVLNLSLGLRNLPQDKVKLLRDTLLANYNKYKVVIVAAAGNDNLVPPAAEHAPASFDFVIGAVASNHQWKRSCYANRTIPTPPNSTPRANDVAAPGGDGGPDGSQNCASRSTTWTATPQACDASKGMEKCRYGVIGLILVNPQKVTIGSLSHWKPDYGYWSGSSFSTAFTSGLAALVFQKTSATNADWVDCAITRGAKPLPGAATPHPHLGMGVINVPRSLTLTPGACP